MAGYVGRLWNRWFVLPRKRFIDEWLLRRHWERFYLVFGGHIFFQTLRTAIQLGIFDLLAEHPGLTRSEIAKRVGAAEQPVRIVLLGCTAVGFLVKKGDRYSNSKFASRLLVKKSPEGVTAYVELQHHAMYKAMPWMLEAVKEYRNVGLKEFKGDEPTIYQRLAHYPELEQVFQFVDFSGVKHLVDVGGGDGTNLIEICRNWPHLHGTVFDSPTVCEIARKNIENSGLSSRIKAVPGNCFADPYPAGADGLMFCHFFTIWSEEEDREILKKCFESLPSGGRVIVFNMMQSNDQSGPLSAAVGSPYFLTLATGKGMLYTWDEYVRWMYEAGFDQVAKQTLQRDHGIVVGVKS
jgi:hypothetical protein